MHLVESAKASLMWLKVEVASGIQTKGIFLEGGDSRSLSSWSICLATWNKTMIKVHHILKFLQIVRDVTMRLVQDVRLENLLLI